MKWILLNLFILVFGLFSQPTHAIVNVEDMRDEAKADGFTGRFSLALSGDSGNTDKANLKAGSRLQWRADKITDFLIIDYTYGESNNILDTNKGFLHARNIRQASQKYAVETFIQVEQNEFARLSFRGLAGGGIRTTLVENDKEKASLGIGAFHAWETLDQKPGLNDDGDYTFWRANLYLALHHQINDNVRVVSTTYYQPAFDDFEDARILEEVILKVKLADNLDLAVSLEVVHDSRPPQTVEKTDVSYTTGIEYKF